METLGDQYGHTCHNLKYPRKDLLNRLNRQHADKMYCGNIAGLWLRVYRVCDWKEN